MVRSDRYSSGLELLEAGGSKFSKYRDPSDPGEPEYGRNIPWLEDVDTGEVIRTRTTGETRLGVFGPTGSSKTTGIKRFVGTAFKNNHKVVHISDVKNDFQKVDKYGGVNKEYREHLRLLPGETPFEMPRVLAIPNFIARQHYTSDPGSYGTRFSWGFEDITEDDFKSLLGGNLNESYEEILNLVFRQVDFGEPFETGEYGSRWEKIIRLAEEEAGSRSNIGRKLRSLKSTGIIDDGMRKDVIAELNNTGCVSLGLKHYENYMNGGMHKLRFYSGLFQRNVEQAIRRNRLDTGNGLILVADEFHILDEAGRQNMFNENFENLLKVAGRQADITTVIASQRPSQVSHTGEGSDNSYDFLGDLTDAVILSGKQNINEADWKTVLKSMGIYRGQEHLKFCRNLFGDLPRYHGVYASSERHRTPYDLQEVRFLCPLVHHPWDS